MIYPSADLLEDRVESRYTLVVLAAKRAKQLREGAPKLIETTSTNPLTIALEEIAAGKVGYRVPSHDEIPARGVEPELEGLPPVEAAEEEAAEVVAEAPAPVDEAARVAQLLEVPAPEEEAAEPLAGEAPASPEPESESAAETAEPEPAGPAEEPAAEDEHVQQEAQAEQPEVQAENVEQEEEALPEQAEAGEDK